WSARIRIAHNITSNGRSIAVPTLPARTRTWAITMLQCAIFRPHALPTKRHSKKNRAGLLSKISSRSLAKANTAPRGCFGLLAFLIAAARRLVASGLTRRGLLSAKLHDEYDRPRGFPNGGS